MSQKKVDAYKSEKKNRKKNLEKQKKLKILYRSLGVLCALAIVGGIGYAVYYSVAINPETETEMTDEEYEEFLEMLNESMETLSANDTDATGDSSTETTE